MADDVNMLLRLMRQGQTSREPFNPHEPEVPASALDAALAFGPVGPAAGLAYRGLTAAPKLTAGILAALGLTAPSAIANEGVTQGVDVGPLQTARAAAERRRSEAEAEMNQQSRTGRGPRYQEAKQKFDSVSDEIKGLDRQIADAQKLNDPEYRLALDRKKAEAADEARTKRANTPVKDLYADYMGYVAPAAAISAGLVGAAIKRPYAARAAEEASDLSQRWARSVGMTPPPGPGGTAVPNSRLKPDKNLADQYQRAFRDMPAAGGDKAAVAAGIGIGELSQLMPLAIDYQRALPGSPLAKEVHEQLTDIPGLAGRMLQGALLGGIPAKIGTKAVDASYARYVPQYGAETNALFARPVAPPNLPGGGGGPQLPPGPGVPPAIPPGNRPQVGPPAAGPPNRPDPSAAPSYRPDKNGPTSRQYIDDLLASGQSLPANAADELVGKMPTINPASIGPRVDATRPLVDALIGAPPEVRAAVLNATIGKPGSKFLGIPAAATGAGALGAMAGGSDAQAASVNDLMALARLLEQNKTSQGGGSFRDALARAMME